jgi:hypothetical protein
MASPYIAATVPAKKVWVSGSTLFHVALAEMGDALHWAEIARMNRITDPWVSPLTAVLIPPVPMSGDLTGVLGQ